MMIVGGNSIKHKESIRSMSGSKGGKVPNSLPPITVSRQMIDVKNACTSSSSSSSRSVSVQRSSGRKLQIEPVQKNIGVTAVIEFGNTLTNGQMATPLVTGSSGVCTYSDVTVGSSEVGAGDTSPTTDTPPASRAEARVPKGVRRAKSWTPEIENCFRFQEAGYRDLDEYHEHGHEVSIEIFFVLLLFCVCAICSHSFEFCVDARNVV